MLFSLVMFASVWFLLCVTSCVVCHVQWYSVARKGHRRPSYLRKWITRSSRVRGAYSGWQTEAGVVLHDFQCHLACHVCVSVVSHVCDTLCRLSRSWRSIARKAD